MAWEIKIRNVKLEDVEGAVGSAASVDEGCVLEVNGKIVAAVNEYGTATILDQRVASGPLVLETAMQALIDHVAEIVLDDLRRERATEAE